MPEFTLLDPDVDLDGDPCFGKHFRKTAKECRECTTPVVIGERIRPLSDVCAAVCAGEVEAKGIRRIGYEGVHRLLQAGYGVSEIVAYIAAPVGVQATTEARHYVYNVFRYLEKKKGVQTPSIPHTRELREHVRNHQDD